MELFDKWQKFAETGKISDYLSYKEAVGKTVTAGEMNINVDDRRYSNKREERWRAG